MTLPVTDSDYAFIEEKTVQVGDPTEAVDDHDALAENTDWLKEAKMYGWRGNCYSDQTRHSNRNGTGTIWIARTLPIKNQDEILCDVSDGIPPDGIGFKQRMLYLNVGGVAVKPVYLTYYQLADLLPYGDLDVHLTGGTTRSIENLSYGVDWGRNKTLFHMEPLWAGDGNTAHDANSSDYVAHSVWDNPFGPGSSVEVWIWVDRTTGDLMVRWDSYYGQGLVLFGTVVYGPAWVHET